MLKRNEYNKRVQAIELENRYTWYLLKMVCGKYTVIEMACPNYYVSLFL